MQVWDLIEGQWVVLMRMSRYDELVIGDVAKSRDVQSSRVKLAVSWQVIELLRPICLVAYELQSGYVGLYSGLHCELHQLPTLTA